MDEKRPAQPEIDLKQEIAKWRGRAVEAAEMACSMCRNNDLDLCRHCRMERIRREATG